MYLLTEQHVLAHYEDGQSFTERVVTAAIESLHIDDVVCPLCLKSVLYTLLITTEFNRNFLYQTNEYIRCTCGLSIDTAVSALVVK